MKLYSIDVQICGTAYIKANSRKEAQRKCAELRGECIEVKAEGASGWISDLPLTDPELPAVSLSPSMTIVGRMRGGEFSLSEENVPDTDGAG